MTSPAPMTNPAGFQQTRANEADLGYARFSRRAQAFLLDALVYVVLIVVLLIAAPLVGTTPTAQRVLFGLIVAAALLYEPLFVMTEGGTLGHRWTNLRVVDNRFGTKLGFFRAFLRFLVKAALGWFSFVSMAFTRRHQAIHDLVTGSHVRVRDLSLALPEHYTAIRPPVEVGILRRLTVIAAYNLLLIVLIVIVLLPIEGRISDACWDADICTTGENAFFGLMGLVWIALSVLIVALGWRGRLPGARGPAA
jgi:uncharacterized RDD family membrane protein YckC